MFSVFTPELGFTDRTIVEFCPEIGSAAKLSSRIIAKNAFERKNKIYFRVEWKTFFCRSFKVNRAKNRFCFQKNIKLSIDDQTRGKTLPFEQNE